MVDRFRALDWSLTPLGPIQAWPQSLRTAVDIMLASVQPVHIGWGPDLVSLYNDGYIPILGSKHPACLGLPYRDVRPEIWGDFQPIAAAVMAGESRIFVDQPVTLTDRPGRPASWFTFSWTPLRTESGSVGGIYGVATETTERILAERALEGNFNALSKSIDEGFCIIEMLFDDRGRPFDYRFVEMNPIFEKQAGFTIAPGQRISEIAPDHEQVWFDTYGRVALTGQPERFEHWAEAFGVFYDVYAFRVDAPEQRRVAVLFRDITERRRTEAALRESEARQRLLIDSWAQAVWETDGSGVVIADSPSWRAYTGQTLEEWLGYGWLNAIHPDDRAYAEHQWREAVAARGKVDAEFRLRSPGGGWRWTNVRAAPVLDARGRVEKWAGMNIDIDARKQAEAALRERETDLARVQRIGGIDIRIAGDITSFRSPEYLRLHGLPDDAVNETHQDWLRRVHPEDRARAEEALFTALKGTGSTYESEYRIIRLSDGHVRWIQARADIERGSDGQPLRLVGAHVDVTAQKEVQRRLHESEERQSFLLDLSDAMRAQDGSREVGEVAVRMLAEHMACIAVTSASWLPRRTGRPFWWRIARAAFLPLWVTINSPTGRNWCGALETRWLSAMSRESPVSRHKTRLHSPPWKWVRF
ncbi:PAS domain-containing protein [Microvirga pudoricolor]|uniref:PAS domain-containing protein n=1 Tax=Microvirga pudoricolor TaxID=2778729 RepID=UPI00194F671C|nr:PAS domain-containing protein [Microvirga pudoricolor]MBM6592951.1 PAS domain-containing protein [Microvirga pudoricolor]